jgi:hypothetical protein
MLDIDRLAIEKLAIVSVVLDKPAFNGAIFCGFEWREELLNDLKINRCESG